MSPKRLLILDTGPLSYFTHGEVFDVFERLFARRIFIPRTVLKESMVDIRVDANTQAALQNGWLQVVEDLSPEEIRVSDDLYRQHGLSKGEAEAVAIAYMRSWVLLCDEKAARNIAGKMGVAFTGSLGILYKAVHDNVLSEPEAEQALHKMRNAKQRIPAGINRFADLRNFFVSSGKGEFLNSL
ncbi:MAG: hypothetical protein QJR06_10780 [Alicyclobacillaceae bacterium]|nr:hypothetical protein [Alicyclobacillaceae bacterium]